MKVFISSVIGGMEPFRDVAEVAARSLGHVVSRAEQFSASPATPQQACLRAVREADAVVLLLGSRYGEVQASGRSATQEEFEEASTKCPVLVFIQEGVARELQQNEFVRQVQDWSQGVYTAGFHDAESLRTAVTRSLHELELAAQRGDANPEEILGRAIAMATFDTRSHDPRLVVAIAGGPRQSILRPREIETGELRDELQQLAMFGPHRVFDRNAATHSRVEENGLLLEQQRGRLHLTEEGSACISVGAVDETSDSLGGLALIEEDVIARIERIVRFADQLLERIDATHKLTQVVPVASFVACDYLGWQTRAEHAQSPNSVALSMTGQGSRVVSLSPPHQPRAGFGARARQTAEDLTVVLRRLRRR
jgi:hypothetical protein